MTAPTPLTFLIVLTLTLVMWLAAAGAPRPEVDPQAVLEHNFESSVAGITAELRTNVAEQLRQRNAPALTIDLVMSIVPRADGRRDITLTWTVYDASGVKLGVVKQANILPVGYEANANDRGWYYAAVAAAVGVMRLVNGEGEAT